MPEPIKPHPTTPTLDTFRGVLIAHAPPCAFGYPPTRSRRSESGARCAPSRLPLNHHRDALTAADAGGGPARGDTDGAGASHTGAAGECAPGTPRDTSRSRIAVYV